jgi:dGTP triphosphohydrolase
MLYSVFCFLLLACFLPGVPANENCSELLTSIEYEARLLQQDLERALSLQKALSLSLSEIRSLYESSRKAIEQLEQRLDDSEKITADLRSSYQARIRNLKSLVELLKQRLSEAEGLNASLEDIEERTMREIEAARHSRDLVASVGIGLAAGMLAYQLTEDPLVGAGSAAGAGAAIFVMLRLIF